MIKLSARRACPHVCHDWPLPEEFPAKTKTATRRLNDHWRHQPCPDCRVWGWTPGPVEPVDGVDVFVPHPSRQSAGRPTEENHHG